MAPLPYSPTVRYAVLLACVYATATLPAVLRPHYRYASRHANMLPHVLRHISATLLIPVLRTVALRAVVCYIPRYQVSGGIR